MYHSSSWLFVHSFARLPSAELVQLLWGNVVNWIFQWFFIKNNLGATHAFSTQSSSDCTTKTKESIFVDVSDAPLSLRIFVKENISSLI